MKATPRYDHLYTERFRDVYPPEEDTFLLLDVLEREEQTLVHQDPLVCVELGFGSGSWPGSGCVLAFLAGLLGHERRLYMGVDINSLAAEASRLTMAANHPAAVAEFVVDDMLGSLRSRLGRSIDCLLFNPPYVPTPSSEVGSHGIEAAWAGGVDGREVIDVFLPLVPELLSPGGGSLYMVALRENRPDEIVATLRALGLRAEILHGRDAGIETLCVLRAIAP